MNIGRWRTAFIYLILSVALFSASGIFFGPIKELQTETEALSQGKRGIEQDESSKINFGQEININENEHTKVVKTQAVKPKTEEQRIKSELALVGIKTAEYSTKRIPSSGEKTTKGTVQDLPMSKTELRTIKDFPSPVKAKPIKEAGNYYSESFQAYLFHPGTDYPQSEGAVIRIKHSGKVVYAGPDPILGQKVEIDCGDDWSVIYGGLENLRVKEGDQVQVNQVIGQIGYYPGAEGVKDQPQLHYEVWHGDEVQVPNIEAR